MATRHPAQDIPDPLTVTTWFRYLEVVRGHLVTGYDALQETAVIIKEGVLRSGLEGHPALMGMDIRLLARKVARPVGYAGDLHIEAVKALRTSEMLLRGALPESGKRRHPRALDVTK
jgi:hypothetical protein